MDPKLSLYGGNGAATGIAETDNACYPNWWLPLCSSTYGWTYPQAGAEHDDAWIAFTGILVVFPAPYGSAGNFDGIVFAANP